MSGRCRNPATSSQHLKRRQLRLDLAPPVIDSVVCAQHVLELFRRTLSDKPVRRSFDRIANRLSKILSQIRKLTNAEK
jgi:hypothetical protein